MQNNHQMWWPFCCRPGCCRWSAPKRHHLANFADSNAFLLFTSGTGQKRDFYKRKPLTTMTAHPVKQHFPHPRGGNQLQLHCCPAPPLINARWVCGLLQQRTRSSHWGNVAAFSRGGLSITWLKGSLWHGGPCSSTTISIPPPSLPRPVSPAAALRWRAAGVKTPSATELLGVNEPCSICAWRALFLLGTLLRDAAQLNARILSCSS